MVKKIAVCFCAFFLICIGIGYVLYQPVQVKKTYFSNGKVQSAIMYKNDKRDGVAKHYYDNGNLRLEIPYVEDRIDGVFKQYFSNGNLMMVFVRKDDKT